MAARPLKAYIETILYGKDYSVTSPKISGYTADKLVVSGTMPADNRTVTVTYTKNGGHHPRPKPTVEIEDDDALGLNTDRPLRLHHRLSRRHGAAARPDHPRRGATIFFRLLTEESRSANLTKTNRYYRRGVATAWYNTAVSDPQRPGRHRAPAIPTARSAPNAAHHPRGDRRHRLAGFDHDGRQDRCEPLQLTSRAHWAEDVDQASPAGNGWIAGYPDGTFGPQRDITRAETMTLVNRVLNRQPRPRMTSSRT